MTTQILFGFHAVTVRLKTAPRSVIEAHVDATRRDQRMRQFVERAKEAGSRLVDSDDDRLQKLCGTHRHQGVVARVEAMLANPYIQVVEVGYVRDTCKKVSQGREPRLSAGVGFHEQRSKRSARR